MLLVSIFFLLQLHKVILLHKSLHKWIFILAHRRKFILYLLNFIKHLNADNSNISDFLVRKLKWGNKENEFGDEKSRYKNRRKRMWREKGECHLDWPALHSYYLIYLHPFGFYMKIIIVNVLGSFRKNSTYCTLIKLYINETRSSCILHFVMQTVFPVNLLTFLTTSPIAIINFEFWKCSVLFHC